MVPDIIVYNYISSDKPLRGGRNWSNAPAILDGDNDGQPNPIQMSPSEGSEIPASNLSMFGRWGNRSHLCSRHRRRQQWCRWTVPQCQQHILQRLCNPASSASRDQRRLSGFAQGLSPHGSIQRQCCVQFARLRDQGQRWSLFVTLHILPCTCRCHSSRVVSSHKRSRLHFLRGSKEEAATRRKLSLTLRLGDVQMSLPSSLESIQSNLILTFHYVK